MIFLKLKMAIFMAKIWSTVESACQLLVTTHYWPVHLLDKGVSSREDASTSWPSRAGLRGRRRTYLAILKRAWSADSKMVR
jgi:hypothetical protein